MQRAVNWGSAVIAAGALAGAIFYASPDWLFPAEITDLPELIEVPGGDFDYRLAGQFRIGRHVVDAPMRHVTGLPALKVMKYQVSQADYNLCVAVGACVATELKTGESLPQVMVSFIDAIAYAKWFSNMTKLQWRLPNTAEWQRFAGSDYIDLAIGDLNNDNDPAQRWLAEYAQQARLRGKADTELRPRGANGKNNFGIADIAANVWEWTDTCFQNVKLDKDGTTILDSYQNCAVRAVEGKHTAYIIEFVRDANVGGCAVGVPPDYLGFRLILGS